MSFFGKINFGAGQTPDNVTITNSSTQILAANTSRKWCIMTNTGNRDIFVAMGQTALVNKGILIGRNGGSLTLTASALSTEAINGITTGGSSSMTYQEGT